MADRDFLVNQASLSKTPNHKYSSKIKDKLNRKSYCQSIFTQPELATQPSEIDYSDIVRDHDDQIETVKTLKNIFLNTSINAVRKPNSNFLLEKYAKKHERKISAVSHVNHSLQPLPKENMFIKKHSVQESVVTDMSILNELEPANPDEGK